MEFFDSLPHKSLLQEELEGESRGAKVLFELLGAGIGRYGSRTCVRVVLATRMVLIQVFNVSTMAASAKPGLFTCVTGVAAFLLWAATMAHWLCALVQRPRCSLRGIQYKVLMQLSVVSSILFGVSSTAALLSLASHWDWTPQTHRSRTRDGDAGRDTPGNCSLVAGGLHPRDRCGEGNRDQSSSTRSPIEPLGMVLLLLDVFFFSEKKGARFCGVESGSLRRIVPHTVSGASTGGVP